MLWGARHYDWRKKAPGRPGTPPEFRKYLVDQPIAGRIIATGRVRAVGRDGKPSKGQRTIRLTVAAGAEDGLLPGMELNVIEQNLVLWSEVRRVGARSAEVELTEDSDDPVPAAGWRLSTQLDYR